MLMDAVICSYDNRKFEQISKTLRSRDSLKIGEIHRVPDARSICEGYNRGAGRSKSEWLLFCHDDIDIISMDPESLIQAFLKTDVFGVCGTERLTSPNWYDSDPNLLRGSVIAPAGQSDEVEHQIFGPMSPTCQPVQAMDGIFIACRRDVWLSLKFDEQLPGYTGYDIDFSYRAYLNGYRVAILSDLLLYHESTVKNFSASKISQWEAAQQQLRNKFRFRGTSENYVKHATFKYESLREFETHRAITSVK